MFPYDANIFGFLDEGRREAILHFLKLLVLSLISR